MTLDRSNDWRARVRAGILPLLAAAVLCAWTTGTAAADLLAAGAEAYEAGDYGEAANVWRPLAEGGDPMAQFNLGLLHETGRGVPEDAAEAAAWYERAARQGVSAAQYNLATLHQTGPRVPQDATQALYWLEVAARHGTGAEQTQATDAATRLAAALPADAVDDARARAEAFVPLREDDPASAAAITLILSIGQIEELQRRLAAHGYDPGPVDGVPGEQTRNAVRSYLADRGLAWPEGEHLTQRLLELVRAP